MQIDPAALIGAVRILDHIPMRTGIQSSEYVRMSVKGNTLTLSLASDLLGQVSIPVANGEDLLWFVERRLLFPFVLPAEGHKKPLDLTASDSELVLKDGRRNARYQRIDPLKGYSNPQAGTEKTLKVPEEALASLQLAARYAGADQLAPELACIWLDKKGEAVYASNKFSVFRATIPGLSAQGPLPPTFPELLQAGSLVKASDAGARIVFASGYLYQTHSEKATTDFPIASITKAFLGAKKWKKRLDLPAHKMIETLTRLGGYVAGASSDETVIKVTAKAGDPLLRLKTAATQGSFAEALKLPGAPAEDWEAEWLLPSIRPFLEAVDAQGTLVISWDDSTPYLFHDAKNGRTLISPRKAGK